MNDLGQDADREFRSERRYSRSRSRSPRPYRRERSLTPRRSYSPRSRSPSPADRYRDRRSPPYRGRDRGYSDRGYRDRPSYRREDTFRPRMGGRPPVSQDMRVYVSNLSYDVTWKELKDFMKSAGDVLHADVLTAPSGASKGCGIVEFGSPGDAQRAIEELSNRDLMGRQVFIREDREREPRAGGFRGGDRPSGGYGGSSYRGSSYGGDAGRGAEGSGSQLFIANLPYSFKWQDVKDMFRQAGNVLRADIIEDQDGRSRGNGTVLFESAVEANKAIDMFNRTDVQGRTIEVRQDRYAGGRGGAGGSYGRPGDYGGGFGGAPSYGGPPMEPNKLTDYATAGGEPSEKIFVRNLPWATSDEDLVELFGTIGVVQSAGIQFERPGRSKGTGVVEMENVDLAQTAIDKFEGYQYGGRPLHISFVHYSVPQHSNGDYDRMDERGGDSAYGREPLPPVDTMNQD